MIGKLCTTVQTTGYILYPDRIEAGTDMSRESVNLDRAKLGSGDWTRDHAVTKLWNRAIIRGMG